MNGWRSKTHWRLYLQGHNGRARQAIIDAADLRLFDAERLGHFIAIQNRHALDCLEIQIPKLPWYVELWQTVRYAFGYWVSWCGD